MEWEKIRLSLYEAVDTSVVGYWAYRTTEFMVDAAMAALKASADGQAYLRSEEICESD